ncbi:transposase InsO family protein [Caballeronia udeis]|uniref:Transposase InsO family protein n=1 Tax=Caballeronia udeis TaxID=1232866 RepID=A0ABW8MQW8_9BURK
MCRRFADYYAASYGAALTLSSTCCRGRYGVAGINTAHSSATTGDAAAYRQLPYIYGCSTKKFLSIDELQAGLKDYIRYYNNDRIKLRLRGLSPVEYRKKYKHH